jgi:hypothetical protein
VAWLLLRTDRLFAAGIAIILATAAIGGLWAGAGMTLGLAGTAFNCWALWRVVSLLGAVGNDQPPPRLGAVLTVFVFLLKLPLLIALGLFAQTLPYPAMPCFLGGIGLVYFALVGWAQVKR